MRFRGTRTTGHALTSLGVLLAWHCLARPCAGQVLQHPETVVLQQPAGDGQVGDDFGRAVAAVEDWIVVGAPGDDERGLDAGAAYVFARRGRQWALTTKLLPAALRPGDRFGAAVAIDEQRIVVGAPGDDRKLNPDGLQLGVMEDRGAAYLFEYASHAWTQRARLEPDLPPQLGLEGNIPVMLPPADPQPAGSPIHGPGDAFGNAVEVRGTHVAVGAPLTDSHIPDVGAVYTYGIASNGVQLLQRLQQPGLSALTGAVVPGIGQFGASLEMAMFPDMFIGQPATANAAGGVYQFVYSWLQPLPVFMWTAYRILAVPADAPGSATALGASVSVSAAGAPLARVPGDPSGPASGVVWLFNTERPGSTVPLLPASGREAGMRFGTSVVHDNVAIFVGSVREGGTGPASPLMRFESGGAWDGRLAPASIEMGNEFGASLATTQSEVVVGAPSSDQVPGGYVAVMVKDRDGDGMGDAWEDRFGLNAWSAVGADGSSGDKDGDGVTNLDEYLAQTHPSADPAFTRYFAEGATTGTLGTWIFLANPGDATATVQLRFLRTDGTVRTHGRLLVSPMSMMQVAVHDIFDMDGVEFSTMIESDQLIVADRAMWWPRAPMGNAYGSHAERAITAPASTWYFAEGATHSGFDLFYLLQNPSASAVDVRVRYLRPFDAPLEKTYTLPPLSRTNIWVNTELFDTPSGLAAVLASTDVAAVIEAQDGGGIIAERALYRAGQAGRPFEAGHESAGVTAPSTDWFFAEGATGDMFDAFFLVANPTDVPAHVRATYLLDDGRTFTRDLAVGANARTNIWADVESFDGGTTFPLAHAAFSTTLTSVNAVPVIAERSMWWPGPSFATWHEAHNSFGSTETGIAWVAAFGHVPLSLSSATYLLIANTTDVDATVRITRLTTSGASPAVTYTVPAHSRFNVEYNGLSGGIFTGFFGAIVESVGEPATPIVVERATYSTELGGTQWPAGTAALLTKIR